MNNAEKDTFLLTLESNFERFKCQCNDYFGVVCDDYEGVSATLTYTDECFYTEGRWVRKDLKAKLRGRILIKCDSEYTKSLRFALDVSQLNVDYVGEDLIVDIIRMYLEEE